MFAEVHNPTDLDSEALDLYLARGWFRMGQTIFTTNFLSFKHQLYSAVWLRILLEEFHIDHTQQKLNKLNSKFRTEIQPASMNAEKEILFEKYKESISFEASASLNHLLYGEESYNIYNTYEINIYDSDVLIATGFFDLGKKSAAGISSFYDPDYKKHSLGKYLIYLKISYCKEQGLEYFYPGYFVPGYPLFDYKLEIGKSSLQYLSLTAQQWHSIAAFSISSTPFQIMCDRLKALQNLMRQKNVKSDFFSYEFYNANLIPALKQYKLFDYPVFLYCFDSVKDTLNPIVVYDLVDQKYQLIQCISFFENSDFPVLQEGHYALHLLKISQILYSTSSSEEMANLLMISEDKALE